MTKYFDETTENILAGLEETQKQHLPALRQCRFFP